MAQLSAGIVDLQPGTRRHPHVRNGRVFKRRAELVKSRRDLTAHWYQPIHIPE